MKLFKNVDLYTPEHLGKRDVLVEGEKIAKIAKSITEYDGIADVEIFDLAGKVMVPGYIDNHVHITGGGGEQGPASRTPEASIGVLLDCGVTTVIGLLGTDGITKSLPNLLAKARALNEEGITSYILTGAYGYPPVTMTGSVEQDMVLIDLVIGVKTAAVDHRSSNPTGEDLIALGTAARRGGMLSNCGGVVTIHMGSGKALLEPLFYALEHSDIPPQIFLPTHMNVRSMDLIDAGVALTKLGGNMDYTVAGTMEENKNVAMQVAYALHEGMELEHLTCSSDGYGSMPRFNDKQECIGLTYVTPCGLHQLVQQLVALKILPLEQALTLVTSNPARVLGLGQKKGQVAVGYDADMLIYAADAAIESVIAKGRVAVWEGKHIIKGRFEI